jgi:hypothetical protein
MSVMMTLLFTLLQPVPYVEPPKPFAHDSTKVVVVTVDATQWMATYKGCTRTWPRSVSAAVVEREAGAFGREVDTPRPFVPRLFSPPLLPVLGGG